MEARAARKFVQQILRGDVEEGEGEGSKDWLARADAWVEGVVKCLTEREGR